MEIKNLIFQSIIQYSDKQVTIPKNFKSKTNIKHKGAYSHWTYMPSPNETPRYLYEMNATLQYLVRVHTHYQVKPVRVQKCRDTSHKFLPNQMQGEAPTKHECFDLSKQFIPVNADS